MTPARPLLAAALALGTIGLIAASPPPQSPLPEPNGNALTKAQMQAMLPKVPLHTEYEVRTNKLGQVTAVKAIKVVKDTTFDVQTYGNAMQAFIRTDDGKAEPGRYKLSYDYDPQTQKIARNVQLIARGGVDPNARGAALVLMDIAKKQAAAAARARAAAAASAAPKR